MTRTHLPLNALRVFDAAARHLSFTRAADELAVTPAAVGQQIRALEELLGVVLFRRTSKGLELTEEAAAGLEPLRSGFLQFEDAVQAMQAGQASHVYTIAKSDAPVKTRGGLVLVVDRVVGQGKRMDWILPEWDATPSAQTLDKALNDIAVRYGSSAARFVVLEAEYSWPGPPIR